MQFTYHAYSDLPELLTINGYAFRDYHNYPGAPRCVILRHDIDTSLEQAVRLAELEADLQIPGIMNSYGRTFFHDFKYLSDRRWREPVLDIIRSEEYDGRRGRLGGQRRGAWADCGWKFRKTFY